MTEAWSYAAAGFAAPALVLGLYEIEKWLARRRRKKGVTQRT